MSATDVMSCVASCGIPCVRNAWPKGSAPRLPWATFALDECAGSYADNSVYAEKNSWYVELYQETNDQELENALEAAIQSWFGPYMKTEAWVDSESCVQTTYYFTDIEKEVNDG